MMYVYGKKICSSLLLDPNIVWSSFQKIFHFLHKDYVSILYHKISQVDIESYCVFYDHNGSLWECEPECGIKPFNIENHYLYDWGIRVND